MTYFVELFLKVAPYLVISIGLNVAAARYFRTRPIQLTSKSEFIAIVSAALIGLVSPLPTYAAIPIGLSLMASGIPFSAIMAFIISSPLMNPTVFFLTATQVGLEMAVARTGAAFLLAILGGLLTVRVFKGIYRGAPIGKQASQPPARSLRSDLLGNAKYMVKFFSITILLSAAVKALVPPQVVMAILGGNAKVSTLVAIGMGVPFYTCGGSAIPFVQTLMEMGMSKGPMLAFFLAGPATKLETLYAYKTLLGTRVLVFFLCLTVIVSYVAGVLYSII